MLVYRGVSGEMVVLGFRPKTAPVKTVSAAVEEVKKQIISNIENKENKENTENAKGNTIHNNTKSRGNDGPVKKAPFSKPNNPSKVNKYKPSTVQISSNWKRLQSMKVFTADDVKIKSETVSKSIVSDSEWFGVKNVEEHVAGMDDMLLRENVSTAALFPPPPSNLSEEKLSQPSKFIALDCEMVGVGAGGYESILARVSVVNFHGRVLLDVYVLPTRKVTDYRTAVSGVTSSHLTPTRADPSMNLHGQPLLKLQELQERLIPLLQEKIVVGHALNNDFAALLLSSNHPRRLIRDTSRYPPFRTLSNGKSPALKMLAARILGVKIQSQSHDSVDDARIAMLLYRAVKGQWESSLFTRTIKPTKKEKPSKYHRRKGITNSDNDDEGVDEENDSSIFNSML